MSLPVSIVWVLTIIAMGIAYVVILNEKPKDSDKEKETMSW